MKKSLKPHHRPIVWISSYVMIGIIGGAIKQEMLYSFLLMGISLVVIVYMYWQTKSVMWFSLIGATLIGASCFFYHPLTRPLAEEGETLAVVGVVVEKEDWLYGTHVVLDEVYIKKDNQIKRSKFKWTSESDKWESSQVGDRVRILGRIESVEKPYNPSDMDENLYLKGEGIGARISPQGIETIGHQELVKEKVSVFLTEQIRRVFDERDRGVVSAILLGDKTNLGSEVKSTYNALGIGHILAISGLHVALFYSMIWWLTGKLRLTYNARQLVLFLGLWGYCFLTGLSVSSVRATGMITFLIVANVLWEEVDYWNALGWITLGFASINPYVIFQVGFQLSFIAYACVIKVSQWLNRLKVEEKITRTQSKYLRILMPPLGVSLGILPILAYHFYEVPLLANVSNLVISSVVALLVPLMVISLCVAQICFGVGYHLAGGVCLILEGIYQLGEWILTWPYATWVTGKPHVLSICIYYGILLLLGTRRMQKSSLNDRLIVGILLVGGMSIATLERPPYFETTFLYVGQGDSTVMVTPKQHVILIDAGKTGKGKVVERFLKYKGQETIDVALVTHAHEDHIAGLIEMIEAGVTVKCIYMPYMPPDSFWANELKAVCEREKIPLGEPIKGNTLQVDEVTLRFLAPQANHRSEDLNELSSAIEVSCGEMKFLFTGDMSMVEEKKCLEDVKDVTFLKVGHHGSDTSTSIELLNQALPEYGIISCGKNNRYHHPGSSVLERLGEANITYLQTDKQGAITVEMTQEAHFKIKTEMEEVIYGGDFENNEP